ncbi:hypothetical protein [Paenibacillus phocaensis]|uniref:hypothetical protein n=1 Tax=Paenibacillus phocaensis TaxID=1776378 RepID=UPI000839BC92|nr:hypothetical protein [Paenibacillus phocaensis]
MSGRPGDGLERSGEPGTSGGASRSGASNGQSAEHGAERMAGRALNPVLGEWQAATIQVRSEWRAQ